MRLSTLAGDESLDLGLEVFGSSDGGLDADAARRRDRVAERNG